MCDNGCGEGYTWERPYCANGERNVVGGDAENSNGKCPYEACGSSAKDGQPGFKAYQEEKDEQTRMHPLEE